ncbi:MAG: HEPN domain-containing protein [Euryarchaeota archaeon]|nr:HEPN domain-containing protein [Euryarchaeota archaeon]
MNEKIIKYVKGWLKKADRDIISAKKLLESGIYDYSLFHSQQAVEKYLKAFLTYHNKPFGKTHDITLLLKKCIDVDESFRELADIEIDRLYPRGVLVRYPELEDEILKPEAEESIAIAEKVREFVQQKLEVENWSGEGN